MISDTARIQPQLSSLFAVIPEAVNVIDTGSGLWYNLKQGICLVMGIIA